MRLFREGSELTFALNALLGVAPLAVALMGPDGLRRAQHIGVRARLAASDIGGALDVLIRAHGASWNAITKGEWAPMLQRCPGL